MKKILGSFLLLLLSVQCSNPTVVKEDGVIKPLSFKEIKSKSAIAKQIADTKVISFKFPEGIKVNRPLKVISTRDKGFVVQSFSEVFLFDAEGNYINELCKSAYAEGEMRTPSDIATNIATNKIYLLDATNELLYYDASTGELIERITPEWGGARYRIDAVVPNESTGGFYILSCNTNESKGKESKYVATEFDAEGNMLEQYLEGDDYILPQQLVTQNSSNQYLMRPVDSNNVICEVSNGAPTPLYRVDFEGKEAPAYAAYNAKGILRMKSYFTNDYYKYISSVTRTPHTLSFVAATPGGGAVHYIYDQNSGGGIRFSANDGHSVPAPFQFADDEYHYIIYTIYSEKDLDERADQLTRYLTAELGVLERGEPYKLVGVKFNDL